ncbi:small multi-drug export protein [Microaerobacter geothermalis]|uniref:COG2426 family protein n=1 Tax=Microaerobacter geothermalis TaxID=674972 RepID=UPI001F434228|nr:COG2426 family protein [Microaerobacter geothermalis]MCF6092758.1 small multi-drug export protein [Microaerobacter geothermalis]
MDSVVSFFGRIPEELVVILISALPFIELRGALPIGIAMGIPFWKVLLLSIIGNLLPVFPLLLLFQPVSDCLSRRFAWYRRMYDWLYQRTMKKSKDVEKYGAIGLSIFTAVPLPTTGAWSACFAASFFNISLRYSFPAIAIGIVIAGVVVGLFSEVLIR